MTPDRAAPRGVRLLAFGGLPLLTAIALAAPGPGQGTPLGGPDLPPQPGLAAAACQPAPAAAPNSWRLLASDYSGRSDQLPLAAPRLQLQVDPWDPCLMYRARGDQAIERSTDSGRTWATVFHDDQRGTYAPAADPTCDATPLGCPASTQPFSASALVVPAWHRVWLGERANGDAVVGSDDAGRTWSIRNGGAGGIGGSIGGQQVRRLFFAPDDPRVAYAATNALADTFNQEEAKAFGVLGPISTGTNQSNQAGGAASLYVTLDGGASWQLRTLPRTIGLSVLDLLGCQVDPLDAGHLWCLELVNEAGARHILLESRDHGLTWVHLPAPPPVVDSDYDLLHLLVIRSAAHRQRLLLSGVVNGYNSSVVYSDDDGVHWHDTPVPRNAFYSFPVLVADPADNDRVLYAGLSAAGTWSFFLTDDGFDTAMKLPGPPDAGYLVWDASPLLGDYNAAGTTYTYDAQELALQADRDGNFYVADWTYCGKVRVPVCDQAHQKRYAQDYWELADPVVAHATSSRIDNPVTPYYLPQGGTPMNQVLACNLPSFPANGNVPGADTLTGGYDAGSVAFDGQDLLYTEYLETGPAPYQGVIHRLDPATCATRSSVTVRFLPADLARLSAAGNWCGDSSPSIDDMAYDPTRNALWLSLRHIQASYQYKADGNCNPYDGRGTWLFRATPPAPGQGGGLVSDARLAFANGCGYLLSYDWSDDSLWTCDLTGAPDSIQPGHLRAADGGSIPTCAADISVDYLNGMATWSLVRPGHLYVQNEDDKHVFEYDTGDCHVLNGYVHRQFNEPTPEDEQMACDSATLGRVAPLATVAAGSVLWLRDADARVLSAFALPGGRCPLGSATHYLGPHQVQSGASALLCASLAGRVWTGGQPLPFQPLELSLDGRQVGVAYTDSQGTACAGTMVTLGPGTYAVEARFAGNDRYQPSQDLSTLVVWAPPRLQLGGPAQLLPPLPVGGAIPPGAPIQVDLPPAAAAPSVAGQPVSQVQPGPVSQGQPVAVAVPEKQAAHQLALGLQNLGQEQDNSQYAMVPARARAQLPTAIGATLGAIGFSLALAYGMAWTLRPAEAEARARERA